MSEKPSEQPVDEQNDKQPKKPQPQGLRPESTKTGRPAGLQGK